MLRMGSVGKNISPHSMTIRFNEDSQIHYLSNEEISVKHECRNDLWYVKSELVKLRKNDRDLLLAELRAITTAAALMNPPTIEEGECKGCIDTLSLTSATISKGEESTIPVSSEAQRDNPPSPPPSSPSCLPGSSTSPPVEHFCFRGLEVVINKRERDETKKRALRMVLNEQDRYRFEDRRRLDVIMAEDDDDERREAFETLLPRPGSLQERISSVYRLASLQSTDEAYLRGLKDAQEARAIFQQSIRFPSDAVEMTQSPSSFVPSNDNGSVSMATGDTIDEETAEALASILSLKIILRSPLN
jgi:hypothetical protein